MLQDPVVSQVKLLTEPWHVEESYGLLPPLERTRGWRTRRSSTTFGSNIGMEGGCPLDVDLVDDRVGQEFKNMVRALHRARIEVLLDVVEPLHRQGGAQVRATVDTTLGAAPVGGRHADSRARLPRLLPSGHRRPLRPL